MWHPITQAELHSELSLTVVNPSIYIYIYIYISVIYVYIIISLYTCMLADDSHDFSAFCLVNMIP